MTFNYIRNQIQMYPKDALIDRCYSELAAKENEVGSIWLLFTLLKWTFQYGGKQYPVKPLTETGFMKIYKALSTLDEAYIRSFLSHGEFKRYFQILYTQQFYLQKQVMSQTFATQLKLYQTLSHKFDIDKLLEEKTGLSVHDMLFLFQIIYLTMNSNKALSSIYYEGFLEDDHLNCMVHFKGKDKMTAFITLLLIDPDDAEEKIKSAPYALKKEDIQSFERTLFTIYPLQLYKKKYLKVVHPGVMAHAINYYIYDLLKRESNFPEEMGARLEKYVACGLNEIKINYLSEGALEKILPEHSKLVDFTLREEGILIECKAIEFTAYASVTPTDQYLYSSLKDSIIKAYVKQMLTVKTQIARDNEEYFGIILTYKELYWSKFEDLYELIKSQIRDEHDITKLPPSNVFVIDLYTWDKIVQIVKDKKATLRQILEKAKQNNLTPATTKLLFGMHLDEYNLKTFDLSYLQEELQQMEVKA